MNHFIARGSLVELVTPFSRDGIDETAYGDFVEWQVGQGSNGLITCGLTGEGPTLTPAERDRLTRIAVNAAADRVPVIAATGSNSTAHAIELSLAARRAGASALLVVTPYYNRPSQEGLSRHFIAIASVVDLPLIIQDAPERTSVRLQPATLERLQAFPNIVGVVGDRSCVTLHAHHGNRANFTRLSGQDETAVPDHLMGAKGCLSSLANLYPGVCAAIQEACRDEDYRLANALARQLEDVVRALALEPEPVGVKYAVSRLRKGFNPFPRLPLVEPSWQSVQAIDEAISRVTDTPERFAQLIKSDDAEHALDVEASLA